MGLDVSHDAWSGAYPAFNRFRQGIAEAAGGGSFPPHSKEAVARFATRRGARLELERSLFMLEDSRWYWGEGFSADTHPGLEIFFLHSDCSGQISAKDCVQVADEINALLPLLSESGEGHIKSGGGLRAVACRFVAGCRRAATKNEPLEFL